MATEESLIVVTLGILAMELCDTSDNMKHLKSCSFSNFELMDIKLISSALIMNRNKKLKLVFVICQEIRSTKQKNKKK